MRRRNLIVLAFVFASGFWAGLDWAAADEAPADRVVVMYFHRTQRCPTCQTMGAYSEEAVKDGFADAVKAGKVSFHFINFQDEANAEFTKSYEIEGPALIVTKVRGGKVDEFKNLKDIWTKVRDKAAFLKYVRDAIAGYQK